MLLGNLLKSTVKKYQKTPVKGISFDSRKVKKGDIFLRLKEIKHQGLNLLMKQYQKEPQQLYAVEKINIKITKSPFF